MISKVAKDRRLKDNKDETSSLIQVFAVNQEEDEEDELVEAGQLLADWDITSLDNDGIEIKLIFADAIEISQGN